VAGIGRIDRRMVAHSHSPANTPTEANPRSQRRG
jgi:hypothetical protein